MAISELYSGSETVSTTEHSLTTDTAGPDVDTTDGIFQCFLDLSALAAGDQFVLNLYEKVTSGGTQRLVESWYFTGVQGSPNFVTPAMILLHGWDFTLDKLAGTDRAITWSIRSVA